MEEYPLSSMELRLKERYLERPDIQGSILTHRELSEYIVWLAKSELGRWRGSVRLENERQAQIATRINEKPGDSSVVEALAATFANQREERYLLTGHDITAGRMFRYMPAHWHTNEYFEVYYCYSGTCPIHLDSEVIDLRHGSVLILAPNVRQASPCYSDDAVLGYYMIRASTFDRVFWGQLPANSLMSAFFRQALSHTKHPSYLHFETAGDPELENLLGRIEQEQESAQSYSAQYLNLLMSEFFLLLLRGYEGTVRLPRTESFFWRHEFSAIFSYIQSHFSSCTLADIAAEFGYSERQLNRIVKSCTGDTYAHLVLRLRMEYAAELLAKDTEISLAAEASGYSTSSSFYRAFAAYYGCTPAQFRAEKTARRQ